MSEVPLHLVACLGLAPGFFEAERVQGTSLKNKRHPLEPYRMPMPRVLGGSWGDGHFLKSEVPLYGFMRAECDNAKWNDVAGEQASAEAIEVW